jgi:hypothetical protein
MRARLSAAFAGHVRRFFSPGGAEDAGDQQGHDVFLHFL